MNLSRFNTTMEGMAALADFAQKVVLSFPGLRFIPFLPIFINDQVHFRGSLACKMQIDGKSALF